MTEQWRPVVGHEGVYEVSDLGNVRSRTRVIPAAGTAGRVVAARRIKAQRVRHASHPYVRIADRMVPIRELVLTAFVGPCPEGCVPRSGDGGPWDVRLSNLEWGPPEEQDRCGRGHRLAGPNLIAADLRRGRRACLACNSARGHLRRRSDVDEAMLQTVSDRLYAEIMRRAG